MPIIKVEAGDNRQQQNIANILASSKRVIVVTGAGISTNCGIPDFRSENGLYTMIQSQHRHAIENRNHVPSKSESSGSLKPSISTSGSRLSQPSVKIKGRDLFSSSIWMDSQSTSTFYTFIASLRKRIHDDVKQTTATHRFIRTLRDTKRLVRCYTQNIDGLEMREGLCADLDRGKGNRARFTKKATNLPRGRANLLPGGNLDGGCEVVQLHGNLKVLRCNICRDICRWEEGGRESLLLRGIAPKCDSCQLQNQDRQDRGKRGTRIGSLRPNIVLYGEEHPLSDTIGTISAHDLGLAPDVLLILGTSLHVHGLKVLVKEFAKSVHARPGGKGKVVFVNLTKPSESLWKDVLDYWVPMDCDEWIAALRRHRPDLWQIQDELEFKIQKPMLKQVKKSFGLQKTAEKNDNGDKDTKSSSKSSRLNQGRPIVKLKARPPLQSILNESSKTWMKAVPVQNKTPTTISKTKGCLQLPTPPPSGHRLRFYDSPRKRSRSDEIEVLETPSKRKKHALEIWQDKDVVQKEKK